MSRPLIFLFPGQSSRDERMFARLAEVSPQAAATALGATQKQLGRPLDLGFASNRDVQLAVCSASLGWLSVAREAGLEPLASAGLSLGEYTHLASIGALEPDDAIALVAARGSVYDRGPEGVMALVQPLTGEEADTLVDSLRAGHGWGETELAVSNYNSPTQQVVAGCRRAVEALLAAADEEYCAVGTVIEPRIAMHTPRFRLVVNAFTPALQATPWRAPVADYWPNVTARPLAGASPAAIVGLLQRHVFEPVRWQQTVDGLAQAYPGAVFVEVGPRCVLRNMLTRRWIAKDRVFALDCGDADSPEGETRAAFERQIEAIDRALG